MLLFTLSVTLIGRGPFKIGALSSTILLVHYAPSHFVGGLALFLGKHHFEGPSLDDKVVHLIARFFGLVSRGILDKGEPLGLLGVIITRNVNIPDFPNATKGSLQILCRYIRRYIPDQQGHTGETFIGFTRTTATSPAQGGPFIPRRRRTATGRTTPTVRHSIIVMAIIGRRRAIESPATTGRSVIAWRSSTHGRTTIIAIATAISTISSSSTIRAVRTPRWAAMIPSTAARWWTSTAAPGTASIGRVGSTSTAIPTRRRTPIGPVHAAIAGR
mmetsp:Transcript_32615/g.68026  ORF Transcript_32615/g.68026 Transcript_32615/m.68026 type:complete len:273 (+) Transcript_32615:984-1802(+)